MDKDTIEILDALEKALIGLTMGLFREGGSIITEHQAKNIVGKIGVRIIFGGDDPVEKERITKILSGEK